MRHERAWPISTQTLHFAFNPISQVSFFAGARTRSCQLFVALHRVLVVQAAESSLAATDSEFRFETSQESCLPECPVGFGIDCDDLSAALWPSLVRSLQPGISPIIRTFVSDQGSKRSQSRSIVSLTHLSSEASKADTSSLCHFLTLNSLPVVFLIREIHSEFFLIPPLRSLGAEQICGAR
jgi:hypothetical protein